MRYCVLCSAGDGSESVAPDDVARPKLAERSVQVHGKADVVRQPDA